MDSGIPAISSLEYKMSLALAEICKYKFSVRNKELY